MDARRTKYEIKGRSRKIERNNQIEVGKCIEKAKGRIN